MNLKQIQYTSLQKIALNNLDITGDNSTALLTNNETAQLATDAVVDFICNFSNMKTVCDHNQKMTELLKLTALINNCLFENMESIFNYYGPSNYYKLTLHFIK